MTQQPDGIRRDVDLHGVTPALPPVAATPPPDEHIQAIHFAALTIALYLLYAICSLASFTVLRNIGFYDWYYGPAFVAEARKQLWVIAAALPFWLVPTVLLCWFLPAYYRRDIGVSLGRFPRRDDREIAKVFVLAPWSLLVNGMIGVAAWLLVTPVVLGLNRLLIWLYSFQVEVTPEEHPFTAAAESGSMRPLEWGMLAVSVMVSAPLWEELLFRGLLPAVCRKLRGSGGYAAIMLALAWALWMRQKQIAEALNTGGTVPLLFAAMPALFVVAMLPVYALVSWLSRTKNAPIVFGTALLFGAVHSFAWPTPVALFIFGLVLGWLAVWTRSLIAPIVVHLLFNAVSYALLFFS
jgi:membrane protease YdiL (CAAX protease family)